MENEIKSTIPYTFFQKYEIHRDKFNRIHARSMQ